MSTRCSLEKAFPRLPKSLRKHRPRRRMQIFTAMRIQGRQSEHPTRQTQPHLCGNRHPYCRPYIASFVAADFRCGLIQWPPNLDERCQVLWLVSNYSTRDFPRMIGHHRISRARGPLRGRSLTTPPPACGCRYVPSANVGRVLEEQQHEERNNYIHCRFSTIKKNSYLIYGTLIVLSIGSTSSLALHYLVPTSIAQEIQHNYN